MYFERTNRIFASSPTKCEPQVRIHCPKLYPQLKNPASKKVKSLENLRTAFDFLKNEQGIDLHNLITPTNIYNGDVRETLELIWTLILRLQIRSFSSGGLRGNACMLAWAQRITKAYDHPNVVVKNFGHSWKSGLPFIAILNHYRPDVIDFKKYSNASNKDACEAAFAAAETIGIERILDVEDLVDVVPEESVVMTYLAKFYAKFADHVSRYVSYDICARGFLIFTGI